MARQVKKSESKQLSTTVNFAMDLADQGGGMEGTDSDSFAIPFLAILQKNSPQVDEADSKYIEGARAGMLLNTVTSELMDGKTGVIFIPCAFQRRFIRWGARGTDEAGFKGELQPEVAQKLLEDEEVVNVDGRLYFPTTEGDVDKEICDRLNDTRNHFGIVIDLETGEMQQVLLSLGSTQIKKSKQLMTMLGNVKVDTPKGKATPPTWANQILVQTVAESNDKGSWHGVKFSHHEQKFVASQDLYNLGKEFHDQIVAGEVGANYEAAEAAGTGDAEGDAKGEQGKF